MQKNIPRMKSMARMEKIEARLMPLLRKIWVNPCLILYIILFKAVHPFRFEAVRALFVADYPALFDGDYALSERAIKEVLDNAETYRKGGSVRWVVTKEGNFVVMRISNDGKLPSPRPQFFEPWARGDSSRHEGGSGLGLPICYQIMNLHGGDVSIDENGNTVTVTLRFPL